MHTIAREYGWSKRDILQDVYPDEYLLLCREIRRQTVEQQLQQYDVSMFPYISDDGRRSQIEALQAQLRHLSNLPDTPARLDRSAAMALKSRLQKQSRTVAVK